MPSSTARVEGRANRVYSPGEREPAQLSKSCTASAPASIWARREATAIAARRSVSCRQSSGSPCISALTRAKRARRAALHGVARHGEGRPGEADQRHARPLQLPAHEAYRLGDVGRVGLRLEGPQAGQVGLAAKGLGHHRSPARLDVDAESDGVQGHDDVGEQDGGVHAVAPDGLQRELGREGGVPDGGEDGALATGGPVLGQGTPRLAHEPHRCAGHRFPQAGAHELGAGSCRRAHPIGSMTTAVP